MNSFCKIIAFAFVSSLLVGCSHTYQAPRVETTDFLHDYYLIKEAGEDDALLSYWKKGVNWVSYKKIMLAPISIKKTPDSSLNKMTHADRYRLVEFLEYQLQEALKNRFRLVNKPDKDTLLAQYAITDSEAMALLSDTFSAIYPQPHVVSALKPVVSGTDAFLEKAKIEGKIMDSTTGELLMASADARAGGKNLDGNFDNWKDTQHGYKYWAAHLSHQLCLHQGRRDCQKPDYNQKK